MPIGAIEIAVVENEAAIRKAIRRWLSLHGYVVTLFESAERFLATPDAGHVSCILADVDLGSGLSGVQLASRLTASGCGTPVILMSASTDATLSRLAERVGCSTFLKKPFTGWQLLAGIARTRSVTSGYATARASGNTHLPERIVARGR